MDDQTPAEPEVSRPEPEASQPEPTAPMFPPSAAQYIPEPEKPRSNRRTWWIIGIAAAVFLTLGTTVCCIAVLVPSFSAFADMDEVVAALDTFMSRMVAKDVDSAYDMVSSGGRSSITRADLEELIDGGNYALFDGYQSLEVSGFNVRSGANANPAAPQGSWVEVNGTVHYVNGYTGSFNAIVQQENGEWLIHSFFVNIPPDKMEDYLNTLD
jgi:hypothetical protein